MSGEMRESEIGVVMADDHQIFLEGLSRLLAADERLCVLGTCNSGDDLIELAKAHEPDVAIIDISMPGPGPAGIVQQLDALDMGIKTLALTMHLEPSFARDLLSHGMDGYVVKEAAFDELVEAILTIQGGDQYLCRTLIDVLPSESALTDRERECLSGAARGLTAKMIARELDITERTVRFHFANACRKLGVQRVTEAVAAALKQRLIAA
ncbi:response regulator transcription factor [Cohaesibacter gelatinilyticus]|uniref:Two component transcriptional regulator, LuxR family n=1 Tax=Cohaesibacter gelatinilyticus TaxID=372072 RepID=A0A285PD67_9HYPH|nr:response regulator transcription factor [Cohaesibacter gelatinilyticus]SNZ19388.1 two component transcriptional regulator, LuxR family [Cohaesibacter gelatinilyticus]